MPQPYNAAQRKDVQRNAKAAALAEIQRREIITQIMVSAAGRSWLWDRLSETSIFMTTHVPGDALASAFQEGRRSVGLSLLADIMAHCPDQFITAMREQNERHLSNNRNPDDSRSTAVDPASERSGSPLSDGGDSGAEPDQDGGDPSTEAYRSPGRDIYVDGPEARS